jgi:hypothetical protein
LRFGGLARLWLLRACGQVAPTKAADDRRVLDFLSTEWATLHGSTVPDPTHPAGAYYALTPKLTPYRMDAGETRWTPMDRFTKKIFRMRPLESTAFALPSLRNQQGRRSSATAGATILEQDHCGALPADIHRQPT